MKVQPRYCLPLLVLVAVHIPFSQCESCSDVSDHLDNPLVGGEIFESDVRLTSDVTISRVDGNGTVFDYTRLTARYDSGSGGNVRSCGSLQSTEKNRVRNIDTKASPPLFVFSTTYAGAVKENARNVGAPVCDLPSNRVAVSDPSFVPTIYHETLDAATEHISRRLDETPNGRENEVHSGDFELHPETARKLLERFQRRKTFQIVVDKLSRGAPPSLQNSKGTLAHILNPVTGLLSYPIPEQNMTSVFSQRPAIDHDIYDHVLREMGVDAQVSILYELANAYQESRISKEAALFGTPKVRRSHLDDILDARRNGETSIQREYPFPPQRRKLFAGIALGAAALGVATFAVVRAEMALDIIENDIRPAFDTIKRQSEATRDTVRSMIGVQETQSEILQQQQRVVSDVAAGISSLTVSQAAQQAAITLNGDLIENLEENQISFQRQTSDDFSKAAAQRAQLADAIALSHSELSDGIDQLALDIGSQLSEVVNILSSELDSTNDRVNEVMGGVIDELRRVSIRGDSNDIVLNKLMGTIDNVIRNTHDRRRASRMLWSMISFLREFDFTPFLDSETLDDESDRAPDPELFWSPGSPRRDLHIDTVSIYTVSPVDPDAEEQYDGETRNHKLTEHKLSFHCDAAFLMDEGNAMPWWTANQILQNIGPNNTCTVVDDLPSGDNPYETWVSDNINPDGTSNWGTEQDPPCRCWVYASAKQCSIALASASDPAITGGHTPGISTAKHLSKNGLDGIAGRSDYDPCQGGSVSVVSERTQTVRSLEDYQTLIGEICHESTLRNLSLVPKEAFLPSNTNIHGLGSAYVVSELASNSQGPNDTNVFMFKAGRVRSDECGTGRVNEFEASEVTVPALVSYVLGRSWGEAMETLLSLDFKRNGIIGSDVTVTSRPFNFDVASESSYSCLDLQFAVTQGKMTPLNVFQPSNLYSNVELWMPPLEPTTPGGADSRKAFYAVDSNPSVEIPMEHLLPGNMITVGDLACWFDECELPRVEDRAGSDVEVEMSRYLYDVPQNLMSVAIDPALRVGTVAYLMTRDDSEEEDGSKTALGDSYSYTLTDWRNEHPDDTFDASNVASIHPYLRRIEQNSDGLGPGDIRCEDLPSVQNGPLCTFLEHFYFYVPATSGRDAHLSGTEAEACSDTSSGVWCIAPRRWSVVSRLEVPLGEISQTVGSVCPRIRSDTIEGVGAPLITLENPSSLLSTQFWYSWTFRGPDPEKDDPSVQEVWDLLISEDANAEHPCYGLQFTNKDGGFIDAGGQTKLQAGDVQGSSQCANWKLDIITVDPGTLLAIPCASQNITIPIRSSSSVAFQTNITFPTIVVDDTQSIQTFAGTSETLALTFRNIYTELDYLKALTNGGSESFQNFTSGLSTYRISTVGDVVRNMTDLRNNIIEEDAERAREVEEAIQRQQIETAAIASERDAQLAESDRALQEAVAHIEDLNSQLAAINESFVLLSAQQNETWNNFLVLNETTNDVLDISIRTAASLASVLEDIANGVGEAGKAVVGAAKDVLKEGFGLFGDLFDLGLGWLAQLIPIVILCVVVYLVIICAPNIKRLMPSPRKKGSNGGRYAEVSTSENGLTTDEVAAIRRLLKAANKDEHTMNV